MLQIERKDKTDYVFNTGNFGWIFIFLLLLPKLQQLTS